MRWNSFTGGHDRKEAEFWSRRGSEAWERFHRTGATDDLEEAVGAYRTAVARMPRRHEDRASVLYDLQAALHARSELTGAGPADLDDAVAAGREAVALEPANAGFLAALGAVLAERFGRTGEPADLEEAVALGRRAVTLPPAGPFDVEAALTNLGSALHRRFQWTGSMADLEESIDLERTALAVSRPGSGGRKGSLSNLSGRLVSLYHRTGRPQVLEEAVALARRAVGAGPAGHAHQLACLTSLGNALHLRYERYGAHADLDESIALARQALALTPGHPAARAPFLVNLANRLVLRYEQGGADADIEEALALGREAVAVTPHSDPEGPGYLAHLVNALAMVSMQSRSTAFLDEAVALARAAAAASSPARPEVTGAYRTTLLHALQSRFQQAGGLADLDEAITVGRDAVTLFPEGTLGAVRHGVALAEALFVRFRDTASTDDLEEAIALSRAGLAAASGAPADRARALAFLGMLLWSRHERTHDESDLDEAVRFCREAVESAVHEDESAVPLANLAAALVTRFRRTDATSDIDDAVDAASRAVRSTSWRDTELPRYLSNLSYALTLRFRRTGRRADLDEAVAVGRDGVTLAPAHHPERSKVLGNHGVALRTRYERFGDPADLDAAVAALTEAAGADSAPASHRIGAARAAADLVAPTDPARAADLLEAAVLLLPQVSPRRLARGDQQHALGEARRLASDAAALVLAAAHRAGSGPDPAARALRLLEAGRTVLIGQALEARDDLSELRGRHPGLADRFLRLRDLLDQPTPGLLVPSPAEGGSSLPGHCAAPAPGAHAGVPHARAAANRPALAAEFAATLAEIRGKDGFASFGLPPAEEDLVSVAEHGPLAVLNVSTYGSHALLLTRDGVSALPLPALGFESVTARTDAFLGALHAAVAGGDGTERRAAQARLREVLEWLWDAAAGPVLDRLGLRHRPAGEAGTWPRLWWVPSGLLSLLPLHAAGHRTGAADSDAPRTVMDRVVSSYTPSVRALHHARRRVPAADPSPAGIPRALGVAMPVTPGLPGGGRLHHASDEVAALRGHLPGLVVLDGGEDPAVPVKAEVLTRLRDCPVAHFACHGHSDATDPSLSRLLLQDHERDPLTVAALAPVVLDHAQLAYLSACRTASVVHGAFLDEAIHLASAFQIAGFPQVVGTLWEVDDRLCVTIADRFYAHLRTAEGGLDTRRAAHALHRALVAVRDGHDLPGPVTRAGNPFLWAAHIHVGA
ncbi:CHAT domain-containing protein [Streptomyces sp. TRM S81-3]|uniref:CHAT domain-containing protein n=1 Tax=Streptomyces griseicoloratus TaxID=2752516 RepID=A0A926L3C1_9ACTN|nr:CHAT domain-containing protein [Streptomyces griseicoloratus]MBD0421772.1 CHAT domain-containing protein [Streptomyces griseicoloratus]